MALSAGDKLASYEILSKLGAGGMGEVYRARDHRLERDVAAKVISSAYGDVKRFEVEAKALAALNHPNILAIYEFGEHEGHPYIISELVQGEPLRAGMGKLSLRQTLDIAAQICDGLGAAHAVGIAHRDLKPENVMLTREGVVKILDFGLAQRRPPAPKPDEATLTVATVHGMVMGTVGYLSPEQATGEASGPLSDIFSMGVMLYEMLGGKRPFQRSSQPESLTATIREDPEALPESVAPGLRQIVTRCLEKLPAKRFQSAADLAFALRALTASVLTTGVAGVPVARRKNWILYSTIAACLACLMAGLATRQALSGPESFPPTALHTTAFASAPEPELFPEFSPDGKFVAYIRRSLGNGQLIVRALTSPPTEPLAKAWSNPRWSPDGNRIYYRTYYSSTGGSVWSVTPSGGEPQPVLNGVPSDITLSPDGNHLLFTRPSESKKWKIFDSSPPGAEPKPIADSPAAPNTSIEVGRFSPDGASVLVIATSGSRRDLWLMPFPVGSPRHLLGSEGPTDIAWYPDSRHIVFRKNSPSGGSEIRASGIDNAESSYLLLRTVDPIGSLSLSPDGRKLVYSNGPSSRYVMEYDLDTRQSARWGEARTQSILGNYSADGTQLLLGSITGTNTSLHVRSPGGERAILDDSRINLNSYPRLSPDGKRIAYIADEQLWVFAGGGKPVRLSAAPGSLLAPCWSNDGKQLAFVRRDGSKLSLVRIPSGGGEETVVAKEVAGTTCAWFRDDRWIAQTGGLIGLTDTVSGEARIIQGPRTRAGLFNDKGQLYVWRFYGAGKEGLALIDVPSGRELKSDPLPVPPTEGEVFIIHPSGRRVAYTSLDLAYDLWMMDMPQPAAGLTRLWRKWTLPPEPPVAAQAPQ